MAAKRTNRKARAEGARTSGELRAKGRGARAYLRRANTPAANETRSAIDKAVARGEKLRDEIEAKISRLLEHEKRGALRGASRRPARGR